LSYHPVARVEMQVCRDKKGQAFIHAIATDGTSLCLPEIDKKLLLAAWSAQRIQLPTSYQVNQ